MPDTAQPDLIPGDWWDSAWSCRRRLSFDNSAQGEDLEDFPVPLSLSPDRVNYALTAEGGADLRFVNPVSGQPLPHEIERWTVDGTSVAWVKVPLLEAGSSAGFIWMYYGNASAENTQDPEAVWSADYELVLHLSNMLDSSPSGLLATNLGATSTTTPWARGRRFNGVDAYVDLGRDLPLAMDTAEVTVTAWIQPDDSVAAQEVISLSVNSATPSSSSRIAIELSTGDLRVVARPRDDSSYLYCQETPPALLEGAWHQIDGVVNFATDQISVYLDGQLLRTCGVAFDAPSSPASTTSYNALGSQDDGSADFYDGMIDEVRLARTARSADWIQAQHLSRTDAFVVFGTEEAR